MADNAIVKVGGKTLRLDKDYSIASIKCQLQPADPAFCSELEVTLMDATRYLEGEHTLTLVNRDGQAAAVYAQTPPLVNACRKPGQWQTYDIIFYAPVFKEGSLVSPARITMLHNGVLVHHNQEIYGPTGHRILAKYDKPIAPKRPLVLAGHNNPVRFRNIWIRPL